MHSHIFLPTKKKNICYCKICSKLSYNGIVCQTLPIKTFTKFDIDPFKLKFMPISTVANYNSSIHQKYLESKIIGISKIKYLTHTFGLKSMVLYKAINYMNQIYLENEISTDDIENVASLCVLLVAEFNECCLPSIIDEFLTKNETDIFYHNNFKKLPFQNEKNKRNDEALKEEKIKHKSNLNGLFHYIKKNVNNYKYWEVLCLKKLNYNLGKYSSYDYLILFFGLGIFFCKENINILEKFKYCVNILDFITNNKRSCEYSQYTLAMSIIKVALEDNNFFDKNVFKYLYGVDLSKKKYLNCSNMIKTILNIYYNNNNSKFLFFNNQLNNQQLFIYINKLINNEEEKNNMNNNYKDKNIFFNYYKNKNYIDIINNSIIINNNFINNNININNNNFFYQNLIINNKNNFHNNKFGYNNNYFINMKNLERFKIKNYNIYESY